MRCEQCGNENADGAMFCSMCGSAIAGVPPAPTSPAMPAPTTPPMAPAVESGWGLATAGMVPPHVVQPPIGYSAPGALPPGVPPGMAMTPGMYRPATGTPFMQDELGSWGARLLAYVVDSVVKGIVLVAIVGGAVLLPWLLDRDAFSAGPYQDEPTGIATVIILIGVLLGLASSFLYDWFTIARWGAGPGQAIAGLKVRDVSGVPVTSSQAAGRAGAKLLLYSVGGICLSYTPQLASAITIGVSDRRQAVHEMMTSTISVRRDALRARGMLD